jgi:hypothetical protein
MFEFDDMLRFAIEAWGARGQRAVWRWARYNADYFGGVLRPIPLVMTHTQPFGKRLAFCSYSTEGFGRTITLNVPKAFRELVADSGTLLHEMVHQYLHERGELSGHDGEPWRREIMRLHREVTGKEIWAGASKTARQDGRVVRINALGPEGQASLTQDQIARWPHCAVGESWDPL